MITRMRTNRHPNKMYAGVHRIDEIEDTHFDSTFRSLADPLTRQSIADWLGTAISWARGVIRVRSYFRTQRTVLCTVSAGQ